MKIDHVGTKFSKMATCGRGSDTGVCGAKSGGGAASRMWRGACEALRAPSVDAAWAQLAEASPSDGIWHSLTNCVAYQAGVWQNLLDKGIADVMQPAAFKMAIVLRHTPSDLVVKILGDMLKLHPQCQDLTSYVLALLTDDEATGLGPRSESDTPSPTPSGPAPLRDLQLYGDCELAVLAAPPDLYDAHADLVRAEYSQLTEDKYSELRIKILNQFTQIPKLFNTTEFESMEAAARENIKREIDSLREHLATSKR